MEEIIHISEPELLASLKTGSTDAFQSIVDLYAKPLLRHSYQRLKNEQDAEDVVQDIFSDLWEKRNTLTINSSLSGYLFTTLKHRMIRRLARADLHNKAVTHLLHKMDEMQAGILELIAAKDVETTLANAIAGLPENMQAIFVLKQKDYSIREIAEAMGLAEQTIKNYNTEMLRRLKKIITHKHPDINHSFIYALIYLLTRS